ncbi:MAG TPA: hypothetical protein ENI62_06030, partial [Gammaproteobacteria bacterium]|nr:hypothetical protein [Gammaproteobacteria bacterium]
MDTTMLFCSTIEQAGLYPIVILKDGHSFVGVWLQPDSFRSVVTDDVTALRKRISLNELIVFETTLITQSPVLPFSAAIENGKKQLVEEVEADFVCAIDILSMLKNALFEFYNLLNISGFLIHYRGILQH